jgi:hypothetical protein
MNINRHPICPNFIPDDDVTRIVFCLVSLVFVVMSCTMGMTFNGTQICCDGFCTKGVDANGWPSMESCP